MNKAMGKSCGVRLLAICVVVTLLAGGAVADGTIYTGTGKGNNGDIVVSVDYSDGVIHSVLCAEGENTCERRKGAERSL